MAKQRALPLSSFGWSLTGALAISLSLPPVGFYMLAWIGLVPLIVRWSTSKPTKEYARELYAVVLTLACCAGFWLLFHPNTSNALKGGFGLFIQPLPLIAAFLVAGMVRVRYGLGLGLTALVVNVVAAEYLLLQLPFGVPWLLMGHTQVEATPFIQTADLGGVLLLSLWVMLLNVFAFLAIPTPGREQTAVTERGIAVAGFAVLVALVAAYGAFRSPEIDTPAGFSRLAVVQPGVSPSDWLNRSATARVEYLTELSDHLISRHAAQKGAPTESFAASGREVGILVWPQNALPYMGSAARQSRLLDRLRTWTELRHLSLITGAQSAPRTTAASIENVDTVTNPTSSAILIRPGANPVQYDQMRRIPVVDAPATLGNERVLLPSGGIQLATALGFESLIGDHVRRFTQAGANVILVLAQNDWWGRSGGYYQQMGIMRLRAIENRRAVILSTMSGGAMLIQPTGQTEEISGWMEQSLASLDVPIYRAQTVYATYGDWVGRWTLIFGLMAYVGLIAYAKLQPFFKPEPRKRHIPFRG